MLKRMSAATTWMNCKNINQLKGATYKDHISYDTIYSKCPEQANL